MVAVGWVVAVAAPAGGSAVGGGGVGVVAGVAQPARTRQIATLVKYGRLIRSSL